MKRHFLWVSFFSAQPPARRQTSTPGTTVSHGLDGSGTGSSTTTSGSGVQTGPPSRVQVPPGPAWHDGGRWRRLGGRRSAGGSATGGASGSTTAAGGAGGQRGRRCRRDAPTESPAVLERNKHASRGWQLLQPPSPRRAPHRCATPNSRRRTRSDWATRSTRRTAPATKGLLRRHHHND